MAYQTEAVDTLQEEIIVHPTAVLVNNIWRIDARISGTVMVGGKKYTFERVVDAHLTLEDE